MKKVVIVGASGFGREVVQWARDAGYDSGDWRIEGFIDDNPRALEAYPHVTQRVLGSIEGYPIEPETYFVCALGLPRVKKGCIEKLLAREARFVTVVHPSAVVGGNVSIGTGCVIAPGVILTTDIVLGDFVVVNCQSSVGHDARLGRWTSLFGHCDVTGHVELGEGVMLGSHASVIPGVKVGDWSVIGAGSAAMLNVPAGATVVGVPARRL